MAQKIERERDRERGGNGEERSMSFGIWMDQRIKHTHTKTF